MQNGFECWIDDSGRVVSDLGRLDTSLNDQEDALSSGYARLVWDDTGVSVTYVAKSIRTGVAQGLVRQLKSVRRPAVLNRQVNGAWTSDRLDAGAAAIQIVKSDDKAA